METAAQSSLLALGPGSKVGGKDKGQTTFCWYLPTADTHWLIGLLTVCLILYKPMVLLLKQIQNSKIVASLDQEKKKENK